jgi:GTPase involved in cell partitioning and DNA repair
VCVLDASEDPLHTFGMLLTELKAYDGKLVDRVKLVVLNKCDLIEVPCTEDYGIKTIKVSALTGEGIDTLQKCMMELIADAEKN